MNLLLLSKADLLSRQQRWVWLGQLTMPRSLFSVLCVSGCHGHSISQREEWQLLSGQPNLQNKKQQQQKCRQQMWMIVWVVSPSRQVLKMKVWGLARVRRSCPERGCCSCSGTSPLFLVREEKLPYVSTHTQTHTLSLSHTHSLSLSPPLQKED